MYSMILLSTMAAYSGDTVVKVAAETKANGRSAFRGGFGNRARVQVNVRGGNDFDRFSRFDSFNFRRNRVFFPSYYSRSLNYLGAASYYYPPQQIVYQQPSQLLYAGSGYSGCGASSSYGGGGSYGGSSEVEALRQEIRDNNLRQELKADIADIKAELRAAFRLGPPR